MSKCALEIGPGVRPQVQLITQQTEDEWDVYYLDANGEFKHPNQVIHEWRPDNPLPYEDNKFDLVFASHVLEHVPYFHESHAIQDWRRVLKPGGELHVAVPSWEWIARAVLAEVQPIQLKPYAFTGQNTPWEVHLNMFTMPMLRSLFYKNGLDVVRARTGIMHIQVNEGEGMIHPVEQHYVAGVKVDR